MRACEIAGLDWSMVLGPDGRIGNSIEVAGDIAKNGRGRRLPLHPELRSVLSSLYISLCRPRFGPVIRSQQGGHMTPKSVVNLFRELYRGIGLEGCSSHSGRRTFITRAARIVSRAGGSSRDGLRAALSNGRFGWKVAITPSVLARRSDVCQFERHQGRVLDGVLGNRFGDTSQRGTRM